MCKEVRKKTKKIFGFTLVELVIAMALLGVLLSITLVAVNPLDQFAKSRNTKRRSDVEAIANAIQQYTAARRGALPTDITTTAKEIASTGGIDLCASLIPTYIAALPQDPSQNNGAKILPASCGSYSTRYQIRLTTGSHFTVEAPYAELGKQIAEIR